MLKTILASLLLTGLIFAQQTQVAVGASNTIFTFPEGWEVIYDAEAEMHQAINSDGTVTIILQELPATSDEIVAASRDGILNTYTEVEFDEDKKDNFGGFDVTLMAAMGTNPDLESKVLIMVAVYTIDESNCVQFMCEVNSEPQETTMSQIKDIATSITKAD